MPTYVVISNFREEIEQPSAGLRKSSEEIAVALQDQGGLQLTPTAFLVETDISADEIKAWLKPFVIPGVDIFIFPLVRGWAAFAPLDLLGEIPFFFPVSLDEFLAEQEDN